MKNFLNINNRAFWDTILEGNQHKLKGSRTVRDRIHTAYQFLKPEGSVLNIGSGQGFLELKALESIESKEYVWHACDISEKGIEGIKRISNKIDARTCDIRNLPYQDNQFNQIVCMEVLEHLHKSQVMTAYSEMKRVIKDKGSRFIFSVPVYEPRSLTTHPVGHLRKYTPASFITELEENGFVVSQKAYTFAFNSLYPLKKYISTKLDLRRPNVIICQCKKK